MFAARGLGTTALEGLEVEVFSPKDMRVVFMKTLFLVEAASANRASELAAISGDSFFVLYSLRKMRCLTTECVQGTSLSFESIDYVHSGDSLPLGMLGICDGITNDVLQENLRIPRVSS